MRTGKELKEEGMAASTSNADNKIARWSVLAYNILEVFVRTRKIRETFMAEDIRKYATDLGLKNPPSQRAWGSLIVKAKREKIIEFAGYNQVKNPKAHMANAGLWRKV